MPPAQRLGLRSFYTDPVRVRAKRFLSAALPAAGSAAAYALTFPPTNFRLLAWVALVPLFVAIRRGGLWQALFVAWLWCVVGSYVAGDWFPRSVAAYFHQSLLVATALFALVYTAMTAPYFMAFAAAYRALSRRFQLLLPLLSAAAWVAAELGRGRLFTATPFFIGNPWGLAGYAQAGFLPLAQIASVTGIYGVSFAVVCVNAAVTELWLALRDPQRPTRRALVGLGFGALPALAALLYGQLALLGAERVHPTSPATKIAIVQGNLDVGSRWRSDLYGRNLEVYLRLTLEAGEADRPAIVFWPEAAMTFFLEDEPLYQKAIGRVLSQGGAELVAGGPRVVGPDPPVYFNSIYAIAEDGSIRGRYDKEYLVPFAEYFPFGIDVLKRRFGRIRVFDRGQVTGPLPTRAGPAGVLVCNEAMLPEVAAARVARGAVYLVNPSNDSWISDRKYTDQQFDIAVMRAIEQRRYLVRVSTAGPSAVIDPWGRIQVATEAATRSVVVGEIRPLEGRSIYGRVGDLFAGLCLGFVVIALVAARVHERRTRVPGLRARASEPAEPIE